MLQRWWRQIWQICGARIFEFEVRIIQCLLLCGSVENISGVQFPIEGSWQPINVEIVKNGRLSPMPFFLLKIVHPSFWLGFLLDHFLSILAQKYGRHRLLLVWHVKWIWRSFSLRFVKPLKFELFLISIFRLLKRLSKVVFEFKFLFLKWLYCVKIIHFSS